MFWAMLAIAAGFCGLAVLGVLAIRVFIEAERLSTQVTQTTQRINRAAEDLEAAATGVARASRDVL